MLTSSLLDKIRAALRRPVSTLPQLADALVDARKAEVEARAAVERQVAAVAAGFLEDDAKRAAARSKLAALRAEAEDAVAILGEAERRHAAALDAEEQVRRRMLYDAAKAEADAAAQALLKAYPTLARGMVAMLRDLATAQTAVNVVNGQLPDGAVPLPDPEMVARGVPGQPREVVSDEWIEAWGRQDLNTPVDEAYQDYIHDCNNGWGKYINPNSGSASMGDSQPNYRKRRFHKIVTREATSGDWPLPLAAALQLPAVRGPGMLWGESFPVHNPALAATVLGQAAPSAVLARFAEIDAAAIARPIKVQRPLRVEYVAHVDVVPLPDQPIGVDTMRRGQPSGTGSRFGASPFAPPGSRVGARG